MQPAGDDVATVLVWVLLDWQAPQALYVNEEQVVGVGVALPPQFSVPWHEFEQVRVDGFQPVVLTTFFTPLACVAEFTVVEL